MPGEYVKKLTKVYAALSEENSLALQEMAASIDPDRLAAAGVSNIQVTYQEGEIRNVVSWTQVSEDGQSTWVDSINVPRGAYFYWESNWAWTMRPVIKYNDQFLLGLDPVVDPA